MDYNEIFEGMAKSGYETMFDLKREELHPNSIERHLWRNIAKNMTSTLWSLYKNGNSGEDIGSIDLPEH